MSHQDLTPEVGKVEVLAEIVGAQLLGVKYVSFVILTVSLLVLVGFSPRRERPAEHWNLSPLLWFSLLSFLLIVFWFPQAQRS